MCRLANKTKRVARLFLLCLLVCISCTTLYSVIEEPVSAFATEVSDETTETTGPAEEEPPFNTKELFVIFTCCLFSVALCVIIGLFGNPNDRLKDKYKRARKQQQLQEKKKKEAEERAAKRAAEEAKYAEELAQYEADVKAYEEAKAAKAAEKAAKKAEKEAKKK